MAIVHHARPDLRPVLAYVAHGLRSAAQDAQDAERVATLASRFGCAYVVLPVEVVHAGDGIEAAARRARHAALEEEADRRRIRHVLYGQHAEDQAETLLLRLVRGSGTDGLAAMAPLSGRRLRPLLDVRRADAHRAAGSLEPGVLDAAVHDPMNDDVTLARVRLRREVMPGLAALGPDPVGALARLADLARAESEVLETLVAGLRSTLPVVTFGPATLVPSEPLRALPVGLARRVLRGMLPRPAAHTVAHTAAHSAATVERLLVAPDGWRATLPGPLDASVDRGWHVILPADAPAHAAAAGPARDAARDPARAATPLLDVVRHAPSGMTLRRAPDLVLRARPADGTPPGIDPARLSLRLHASATTSSSGELHVRTRRDGDRVRTAGGTRSLGDVLAEAGVPRALRDLLPVVVDGDDVVWVPGVVADVTRHDRSTAVGE